MQLFTPNELLLLSEAASKKVATLDTYHPERASWIAIDRKLDSLCMEAANNFINSQQQQTKTNETSNQFGL